MATLNDVFLMYIRYNKNTKKAKNLFVEKNRWENHIYSFFKEMQLVEIKSYHILEFRYYLEDKKLSPQTVYHYLSLIKRTLNKAILWECYPGPLPVIEMPKFDNKRVRFLNQEEAYRLLFELKKRSSLWQQIAMFAIQTGLRAGEIFALQKEHFDINNKLLHILDTKTGQNRSIPLNDQAYSIVKQKIVNLDSRYIFSYPSTPQQAIKAVSCTFPRAVEAVKLNDNILDRRNKIVFHSLRHTFASWLVQCGTPLLVVSSLLGHTSTKMTMRYAHLAPNQGREAVKKLPAFF